MNNILKNKELELFFLAAMEAAVEASKHILEVYATEFNVSIKSDNSPVTLADKRADDAIRKCLLTTGVYVLSEEQPPLPFNQRKDLKYLWVVDPLDGTKEFIHRNDEFTVNIALIKHGYPVMGIITAPALNKLYWAIEGRGFFMLDKVDWNKDFNELIHDSVEVQPKINKMKIIGSRSHANQETQAYVNLLKAMHPQSEVITKGSSLKLCKVALGEASFYPRFSPINEWDIAAGTALVEISGGKVLDAVSRKRVLFNKDNLFQPPFIAIANGINPERLP